MPLDLTGVDDNQSSSQLFEIHSFQPILQSNASERGCTAMVAPAK
jgi:hypothetical protein